MIISRTPIRVSFFGGGTDYRGYYERKFGQILGSAIDKYVYVSVSPNSQFFDYKTRVAYRKTELVTSIDDIEHPSVKACLKFMDINEPLDINIFSDIPARTGLGSSSSFTVGFLNALYALKGKRVSSQQLAENACYVEQEIIKEKVGSQDQFHAAFGGLNTMTFKKNNISVEPLIISDNKINQLNNSWMMFFTGITRYADPLIEEQVKKTNSAENDNKLDEMIKIVEEAKSIFSDSSDKSFIKELGALMHANWEKKKQLSSKVSNAVIDNIYTKAISAGAYGGKLSGAGAGGFLSFIVPIDKQDAVKNALSDLEELPFKISDVGSSIIYFK
jgi:D-glycero-alpha-D-manno-heptose-7-phosphate kinase